MDFNTEDVLKDINKRRSRNIMFTAIVGIAILIFYVFVNLITADYSAAIFEFICVVFILIGLNLFHEGKHETATNIGAGVLVVLSIHNFNAGGFYGTGIFWVFLMVSILFYIKGKNAIQWVALIHISIIFLSILEYLGIKDLPYSLFTILTFYISLLTITIITYIYTNIIEVSLKGLRFKTNELEDTMLALRLEETKIKSFKKEIEDREKVLDKVHKSLLKEEFKLEELKDTLDKLKNPR